MKSSACQTHSVPSSDCHEESGGWNYPYSIRSDMLVKVSDRFYLSFLFVVICSLLYLYIM